MSSASRAILAYLAIALLAFVTGLPALRAEFVFDDAGQVLQNPAVRNLDIGAIWTRGYWANASETAESIDAGAELYRPLTTLSIALSYQLHGSRALGYRIENLLLHGIASALLLYLTLTWGLARRTAVLCAAFFAVLPVHCEVLGSIILRNELIAAAFAMLALAAHARGRYIAVGIATLGALLAKESAIALPLLAFLADRAQLYQGTRSPAQRWRGYAGFAIACVIALTLRITVIGQLALGDPKNLYFHDAPSLAVWLTMARFAALHYLSASAIGTPLVFDFSPRSFETSGSGDVVAWLLLLAWICGSAVALIALWRRRSHCAFGLLFFIAALGPTANLVTRIGILGANRLAYFPSAGLMLILALSLDWLLRHAVRRPAPIYAAAGLLLFGYAARSWQALAAYAHPMRLYSSVIEAAPQNAFALGSRGLTAFSIALGQTAPPPEAAQDAAHVWMARAYDDLHRSLEVDPSRWRAALPNLVLAAFQLDRALELAPLFASCLRRQEPEFAAIELPSQWDARVIQAWPQTLQRFRSRGSRERALIAVARILAAYAAIAAFEPQGADEAALEAQKQRIAALGSLFQTLAQDPDPFVRALLENAVRPGLSAALARQRAASG